MTVWRSLAGDEGLLGLVVTAGESAKLRALVRVMAESVEVRSLGRCRRAPDALLVSSEAALAVRETGREIPIGCCDEGGVQVGATRAPLAVGSLDVAGLLPRGPLVRRRWREREGRPAVWVVNADAVPAAERSAALATCSAAVVSAGDLPLALALGTPVVTSDGAARALGAEDGLDLLVARDGDDPSSVAAGLATDEMTAARLGVSARRLAERQLDVRVAAHQILDLLGFEAPDRPVGGCAVLEQVLADLHTPRCSPLRTRAADATSILEGVAP